jgi:hypothetical protein
VLVCTQSPRPGAGQAKGPDDGSATTVTGWAEIGPVFRWLGESLSDLQSYRILVALEHVTCSMNGAPPRPYVLRATTVFRRENGEWLAVHRHGDPLAPPSGGAPGGSIIA